MTQGVSGLNSGANYYLKVVVDDGNGGVTESKVQDVIHCKLISTY